MSTNISSFWLTRWTSSSDLQIKTPKDYRRVIFGSHYQQQGGMLITFSGNTSSEEHDGIFAFANLFPDIIDDTIINYEQPIQGLMVDSYGQLAD
ncbi:hypothetical protein BDB00DRAFT_873182 [Zychaea mexicana]|uniref:uncharacterized protein n=1 Tax=Zychaea mexicana TaxID=64656 RepID=UPI0022FEA73A|nr:uncharacterized protein BDB00DRAFT_873182 [Zychaea mexicana]KAI9492604.1 hypothetical protein BDB00DRAFT_873182 [Zychaea mexicana]